MSKKVEQGVATRSALVAAARGLFGERGFANTSTEDLAAAAHVTKGALYHHFTGKEDLFRAVYEDVKRDITEQVAPSFLDNEPWAALVAGCQRTLDAHMDPHVRRIVLLDGRAVLGWEAVRQVDASYGAVVLRGALRKAMHAGVIDRQPLGPLSQMLNGALAEACVLIAEAEDQAAARAEVGATVERLLEGLRVAA